jgi:O-acetyl-ADP-ribose deacetylase (regulator of RNase III)
VVRVVRGDLFEAKTEALVNAVNTVGVMGKGLALQFKQRFGANFAAYRAACERGEVEVGRMFVYDNGKPAQPRYIINFPTKRHWRDPARLEYVTLGLQDLRLQLAALGVRSVAVPALGCGLGGLDWSEVAPLIRQSLETEEHLEVLLFEPT